MQGGSFCQPPRPAKKERELAPYETVARKVLKLQLTVEACRCLTVQRMLESSHVDTVLATTTHLVDSRDVISVPRVAALGVPYQPLQEGAVFFVSESWIHSEQDVSSSLKVDV